MQIDLNSDERRLLLIALLCPQMKDSIQIPATPRRVRDTWKALVEKLKRDEKLHNDLAEPAGGNIILTGGK